MPPSPRLSVRIRTKRARREDDARPGAEPFALDVQFEAPAGITILFGPSGCGKSTLLACIAGLLRPDEGRVALGDDVWFDSEKGIDVPAHRRGVAFVFQSLALFPHMSAVHNVTYGMSRALPVAERDARAREILGKLRVGHLADRRPATFSGGEAQRVALARAFAMSPRIALFDEPFSAMDRQLRNELVNDVRTFVGELGIPLVHVTHQRNEARALGNHVILLEAGRVVREGTTRDLLPQDSMRAVARDMSFDETPLGDDLRDADEAIERR
jgi:molybdate transport system ATP-binding protein